MGAFDNLGKTAGSANPWGPDAINGYAEALEKLGNLGVKMFKEISEQQKENRKYAQNNTLFQNNQWRFQFLESQKQASKSSLLVLALVAVVLIYKKGK